MIRDLLSFQVTCKVIYSIVIAGTTATLSLCPLWQGVNYHRDQDGVPWHASEPFRLRGVNAYNQAPIWAPPLPWSFSQPVAQVRFPWQPITEGPNVEIMLGRVMTIITAVAAMAGVLLRVGYLWARQTPDRFACVVWYATAGLIAVEILMGPVLFALLGTAWDAAELLFIIGPTIGVLGGVAYGVSSTRPA